MSKYKTIFQPFENIYDEDFIKLQKARNKISKYIRTKDGKIIDTQKLLNKNDDYNLTDDERVFINCLLDNDYERLGWKRRVVKQANTIEELCDEFIFINKIDGLADKTHTISFEDMPNHQFTEPTVAEKLEYIHKRYKYDLDKIKLGIWTEKGLIYVAKMNNEGVLELI